MQSDLRLVARIVRDIDERLAQHKDEYLEALLRNIDRWQRELYRCYLLELPTDLLATILLMLSPTQAWKLRIVCRTFKVAAESEGLWRAYCERYIDTSDPKVRMLPYWWAEYQQYHISWQAMDAFPDEFVLALETGLRWSAVNESTWRTRRSSWAAELRTPPHLAQKLATLLLELEQSILSTSFQADWASLQTSWRERVAKVRRVPELALLLLMLEEKVLSAKFSESWLHHKQQSWRAKLTLQHPPQSPADEGRMLFDGLMTKPVLPNGMQYAYA